jgi:hypothetical protein
MEQIIRATVSCAELGWQTVSRNQSRAVEQASQR